MSAPKLTLFFSHGTTLKDWDKRGLFDRETAYYRELSRLVGDILFVTYDKRGPELDERLARLAPIKAIFNRWPIPYQAFSFLGPLLHFRTLAGSRIFKTNQLNGAWTGAIASKLLHRPLIMRCGYVQARYAVLESSGKLLAAFGSFLDRFSARQATLVFVSSESDAGEFVRRYGIDPGKIRIVPNPIDTEQFTPPAIGPKKEKDLFAFTGRFSQEKNLPLLMEACNAVPESRLLIIGSGPLESELRAKAPAGRVEFAGMVPNRELPGRLRTASAFILPSKYEGTPKALLEAMACGLPVIGTDVPGIRDIIKDRENGLLCGESADSIARAMRRLMEDPELGIRLGKTAREYVVNRHSQKKVAELEASILKPLLESPR